MNPKLKQAIDEVKAKNFGTGRNLLLEILESDPKNETAWLYLAFTYTNPTQREKAFRKVLQINPYNETAKKYLQEPIAEKPMKSGMLSDSQILDDYSLQMVANGWQIINKSATAVQLKYSRRWNRLLIIGGLVTIPLGIGLFVLVLAVIDYLIKPNRIITVYANDLRANKAPTGHNPFAAPLMIGGLIIGGILLMIFFSLAIGWLF